MERWATFDCYGTLVDWNAGIRGVVGDELLDRYHELEPEIERERPAASYREVMAEALRRLGLPEPDALGDSLPRWPVFPEVRAALAEARGRGWKLAILSNTDRDLLDASLRAIAVPFDETVVASELGSYKPAHGHWQEFFRRTGADRAGHVHVAQSHFHDVVPATELGLRTVWINRLGERREPRPTRELRDLSGLADTLDELVPA
ncbi:MAG TPA: HAD-IA family hydrolase [Gaiellaceae bacterium]|nr:HAD-IA family hydrolase [Gaiellaceae bacterium]